MIGARGTRIVRKAPVPRASSRRSSSTGRSSAGDSALMLEVGVAFLGAGIQLQPRAGAPLLGRRSGLGPRTPTITTPENSGVADDRPRRRDPPHPHAHAEPPSGACARRLDPAGALMPDWFAFRPSPADLVDRPAAADDRLLRLLEDPSEPAHVPDQPSLHHHTSDIEHADHMLGADSSRCMCSTASSCLARVCTATFGRNIPGAGWTSNQYRAGRRSGAGAGG